MRSLPECSQPRRQLPVRPGSQTFPFSFRRYSFKRYSLGFLFSFTTNSVLKILEDFFSFHFNQHSAFLFYFVQQCVQTKKYRGNCPHLSVGHQVLSSALEKVGTNLKMMAVAGTRVQSGNMLCPFCLAWLSLCLTGSHKLQERNFD